jgi:hypothetical protein
VALAAVAAVLGVVAPAGAATAAPKAGVAVWARPAGPLVASATNAGSYLATFTTSALAPDRYVVTLPAGATRPSRVGTSLVVGCRAASPVIGTDPAGRWTISVALSCTRTSTTFTTSFATALTKAGTTSFGWQVARGSSPSITGSLTGPRVVAAPLASVGLAASPTSLVADGTSTSTLTATPVDAFGNPVAATLSVVSSGFLKVDGTPEPATDPTVSGFSGTTATVTAGTRLGAWTGSVQAVSGSVTRTSAPASITFTRGPLATLDVALAKTDPVPADGAAEVGVTVTAKDAQGRTLTGQSVGVSSTEAAAKFLEPVQGKGDGTYTTRFKVGGTAGDYAVGALSGSVTGSAPYTTVAAGGLAILTRGEVFDWVSDFASIRDGAPLLGGAQSFWFRATWTSPRTVPASSSGTQELRLFVPDAIGEFRGDDLIGDGCNVAGVATERLLDGNGDLYISLTGFTCSPGGTITFEIVRNGAAFQTGTSYAFRAVLTEPTNAADGPNDAVASASVTAVAPEHSVSISVGDRHADDPYTRTITLTVLGPDGQVETGFNGGVQFGRARCGIPFWATYPAVDGVATFDVVSPDKGQTFIPDFQDVDGDGNPIAVTSPTSTDPWTARTSDALSLISFTQFQLGPEGPDQIGLSEGYECPTRSGF